MQEMWQNRSLGSKNSSGNHKGTPTNGFVFLGFPASSHRQTLGSFLEKHQLDKEFSYAAISAREAINAGVDISLAGWDGCQQPRSFLTVPGGSGWLAIFIASSLMSYLCFVKIVLWMVDKINVK